MNILLKNAEIITLNSKNDVYKDYCIGITNGKIDYIGNYEDQLNDLYDKIIDCRGNAVMPGFVNAHNHVAMTMLRNYADDLKLMDWLFNRIFPLEDKFTDETVYWGAQLAILEMIKSGTTTFTDMYFFMNSVVKAVEESGIRACLSRGLTGDSGEELVDERLREGIELYKNYNNSLNGRIKVNFGPHSVYTCSLEYLKKIAARSSALNIPVQIHLSETKDEVKNCVEKYGVSPVKLLDDLGMLTDTTIAAHCVVLDDEDIDILSNRNVNVVHNPGSNLKLSSGIAPVSKMISKGINVCLGTDGAASNNNLDMLEEVRLATYLQKLYCDDPTALPVDEVLKMATVNGAKSLGFSRLGEIVPGMKADLIMINTNKAAYYPKYNTKSAIVYSGSSADVEMVIIDGNIVMEDKEVKTLDEERILFEVQRMADILTK